MASAACGSPPIAKMSPRLWLAAMRPNSQGSSIIARNESTVWTTTLPGGVSTTAASSGSESPISTSVRATGSIWFITRASTVAPDLGPAAAAAHRDGGELPDRFAAGESARQLELRVVGHVGELGELAHEPPIDPVLPSPHPGPVEDERAAAGGDGAAVAGADEAQVPALRGEPLRREPAQRAAQVAVERGPLPDREDPGLLTGMREHRGAVSGREDAGMGRRLEGRTHRDEAALVGVEARRGEPGLRPGRGDPQHLVELVQGACGGMQHARITRVVRGAVPDADLRAAGEAGDVQRARSDAIDPGIEVDPHAALGQHPRERGPDPGRVARQHLGPAGEQVEAQPIGIAARLAEPRAEPVPHREHHLHPAGPGAHHADPYRALAGEHPVDERVPAGHEIADRLDRHHCAGGAGHIVRTRRRADVDREHVVGHGGAVAAQDVPRDRVEIDRLVVIEARVREAGEGAEIDVDVVVGVVSCNVAREHARVGRLDVAADEGDPDPGHRLHPESLEHDDVAVPAADQHEILDDGCGAGVHDILTGALPPARFDGWRHTDGERPTPRRTGESLAAVREAAQGRRRLGCRAESHSRTAPPRVRLELSRMNHGRGSRPRGFQAYPRSP